MSDNRIAYRYALAVLGVAEETQQLDVVYNDFGLIEKLLSEVREFSLFLKSPVIRSLKKKHILNELLKPRVSDLTLAFVLLLTTKDRERLLLEVIREFYKLRDRKLGILQVMTHTTVTFTPAQKEQLVHKLATITKKNVKIEYVVDSSLRGGFTVQFEDTVWDASVKRQLERIEQRFIESVV
jgi:F-type H+-transporting ATPase subunit delta